MWMTCETFHRLMQNTDRVLSKAERAYISEQHGKECKFCVRPVRWYTSEELLAMKKKPVPEPDDDDEELCSSCEGDNLVYLRTCANGRVFTCKDCGEESLLPEAEDEDAEVQEWDTDIEKPEDD